MSISVFPLGTMESLARIKELNSLTGDVLKGTFDVRDPFTDAGVVEYMDQSNLEFIVLKCANDQYNVYEMEIQNGQILDLRFTAQNVSLKHFARILKTRAINWFADHALAVN